MLVMFRVKNFSSFHDEVILDLRATAYKEHQTHIVPTKHFNLLKTIAIYGANASGKSNLISALYWFERYIFNQLFQENTETNEDIEIEETKNTTSIEPFLLKDPIDLATEFEMVFIHDQTMYQYGFSFSGTKILTEWLSVDNYEVFDRTPDNISYGPKYNIKLKNFSKYREDRLYLSVLDYFATDEIKEIVDHFKSFFKKKYHVHFEVILESSIKGTFGALSAHSKRLVNDEDFRRKVTEYINKIDVGIEEVRVEKEFRKTRKTSESQEVPVIKTVHPVFDEIGNRVGSRSFDVAKESSGTLRFLSFIQDILFLMESGGIFIIDELSSRLHPLLTKFIVDMFQSNENTNNAQLIFTTHDTSILNKDQFRRDEIVFIDKNYKGESTLYSLADLKTVRPDATYNKSYFSGRFGAIPIITNKNKNDDNELKKIHPPFREQGGE
jgi:AAA15 family ATPase/GTPase